MGILNQRLQKCLLFIALAYGLQPACGLAGDAAEIATPDKAEDEIVAESAGGVKAKDATVATAASEEDVKAEGETVAEAEDGEETITISGKKYQWVESSRRYLGQAVKAMTSSVDSYLSSDKTFVENDSLLRLRLGYVFLEDGQTHPNNDIKLKVDLPKTKNKWSLIFETAPEELQSLEEQKMDSKGTEQAFQTTDGSIGALRFMLNDWRHWENDFDLGVKMPLPLNPFVRFNTKRRYQINKNWGANIKHSLYYFREEKFGEHTRVLFDRPLNPSWTFFNGIDLRWQDEGNVLEYADVFIFEHRPTDRDVFSYRTGAFYQEHPKPHLQSYFVDMVYRRRLYSHWLYGEVTPSVTWSETDNFNDMAGLTFRLEVIFD